MISLSGLGMRFGAQILFEDVDWRLAPGVHYGLAGANGSGKSTLLKLMSGELKPEEGGVSRPNDLRLGVLPQDSARHDGTAVLDVVIQGRPRLWDALLEKARLEAAHAEHTEADARRREEEGHRLAELEGIIADEDGYTAEARAGALLEGLGIPSARHRRPMSELSGGYRLRVLLAQTLFQEAELLLLDEPTNHLDIVSIRWLESYLRNYRGTIVLVSHDRHFLNAVCNEIADLDYGELTLYTGNYDQFEAAKALAERQRVTETERLEKKIAETQQFIDRFKAKATKARQAGSRAKQVERLARDMPVIKVSSRRYPKLRFGIVRPSGQDVILANGLHKGYGGVSVLRNVTFDVRRGEKLAVVGPNGIGKSTLLKLIAGQLEPDSGTLKLGHEVRLGYFGQEERVLGKSKDSLVEWLHNQAPREDTNTIRGMLGRVLFSGDDAEKATRSLSGGETARLLLAALMLKRDNLLVLDEPTNHLDLEGREALLHALQEYEGTLVFVSHDRHFVSSLARRVLALTPQGYEDFHGSYEEYLAKEGADYLSADQAAPSRMARAGAAGNGGAGAVTGGIGAAAAPPDFESRKAAKREAARLARQVGKLESEIQELEARIASADRRFAEPGYYDRTAWDEVSRAEGERAAWREELNGKMEAWASLSAQLEQLGEAS